jgi:hypothetical protein
MSISKIAQRLLCAAAILAPLGIGFANQALASDHADTAEIVNRIGADLTDVFIFPSPTNPENVVLVLDAHGLIPGGIPDVYFDPRVLYQFKIDNTGDFVEDLVIQLKFGAPGPNQPVYVSGPEKPRETGTTSIFGPRHHVVGAINREFHLGGGMLVFAGLRADPFFFDVGRFNAIFPDRRTPLTGKQIDFSSIKAANTPQLPGFLPPGEASDSLEGLNVLSIVVELPRTALAPHGKHPGVIRLWETTSVFTGSNHINYRQLDRLARPVVNEALATVTDRRHEHNDKDDPTDDANPIAGLVTDIDSFLRFPAGRSEAIRSVIKSVLVPDVMVADLSQTDGASYLGYEVTRALSHGMKSSFGGRSLKDDVIDISLGIVFGHTIPTLGLAPDDGAELPSFSSDNVSYNASEKHTLEVFPYVGHPN